MSGNADVLNDTGATGRNAKRSVLHVGSFLTEDCAQKALLRSEFSLGFRSDLTNQNVTRFHFGTNTDDAIMIEVFKSLFADVRDITSDFLRSELGITSGTFELTDVDRSVNIILDHTLRDHDGILEVVSVPWHEGHKNVCPKSKLTELSVWTIGDNITDFDLLTGLNERLLVDAGTGVRTHELTQRVNEDTLFRIRLDGLGLGKGNVSSENGKFFRPWS